MTKKHFCPLPLIDDILSLLGKAKFFTSLDLKSRYWQVAMDEKDKEKTAFACHKRLLEFNVMPFGLSNAPAVFQELTHRNTFLSSPHLCFIIVFICDLFVSRDDPLMS